MVPKAFRYSEDAQTFLEAARRVLGPPGGSDHDLLLWRPASFLIGHAAELGLIAFLSSRRVRGSQAGEHNLVALLASAEAAGLELTKGFGSYIRVTNDAFGSHAFRYPKQQHPFMSPRHAIRIVAGQIHSIHQTIAGAPNA